MGSEGWVLRYGIIGVGMMGWEYLYNLVVLFGVMVVVVVDFYFGFFEVVFVVIVGLKFVIFFFLFKVRIIYVFLRN